MNTSTSIRERVESAHRAWQIASRDGRRSIFSVALDQARQEARQEFATQRGWRFTDRYFSVAQLLRGSVGGRRGYDDRIWPVLDHREYLKQGRRPVAILTHTYASDEAIKEFAESNQLYAARLPYSWYYPNNCAAILFTPGVRS